MKKQYIVDEIRRTAGENGGVPLGRERFFKATGIREHDWSGIYWARWNEALQEAGFAPNKLQGAHAEETLLRKYTEIIRELERVPTVAELRIKRRRDPSFPDSKVFERFGDKSQRIAKVLEYCRSHPGFEDVVSICEGSRPATEAEITAPRDKPSAVVIGEVYMLKMGRHYKIGRTNAFGRRERELAIQLPVRAKKIHVIKTDDPVGIERYWHNRFEAKRTNPEGEFFALDSADVSAFRRRKFM